MKKRKGMMRVGGGVGEWEREENISSIGRNTGYFSKQVKDMKLQM